MRKESKLFLKVLLSFTLLGPFASFPVPHPAIFILGVIPAFFAGLFHAGILNLVMRRTTFFHMPFDFFRCLYLGFPLGLLSGAFGVVMLWIGMAMHAALQGFTPMNFLGLNIIMRVYLAFGIAAGGILGAIVTPVVLRKHGS